VSDQIEVKLTISRKLVDDAAASGPLPLKLELGTLAYEALSKLLKDERE